MVSIDPVYVGIIGVTGFVFGIWLAGYMNAYRWMRIRRRVRCFFGRHDAGPVRDMVGGRRVQRCDWCDKVVHEYQVTINEAKQATIRRIY